MKVSVKVQLRASKERVVKSPDGSLKVYLREAPVDGKANQALIEVLSDYYGVKKKDIRITKGVTSRQKLVEISSIL